MKPTDEQLAILDADRADTGNLMINALAGTGKSATLKMLDKAHTKPVSRLYLVFNKRNSDEAKLAQKEGEFSDLTKIQTLNSCGLGIWRNSIAHSITMGDRNKPKFRVLWDEGLENLSRNEVKELWEEYSVVKDGIEKAKSLGYVPPAVKFSHKALIDADGLYASMDEQPSELAKQLIDALLTESIVRAYKGFIDFNDQVYMPAVFGGAFPKFHRIMVDEYQDQSPVNHALLQRLVKGRLIGVGDPHQNIYGFRGAVSGGMGAAVRHYHMTELNLSVSFRCPSAIVEAARWRVPHFKWFRSGGSVNHAASIHTADFPDDSTIICRNNAPLLSMAFKLISGGRGVTVVGSDLGPRIVGIMKKLGNEMTPKAEVVEAIELWRQEKVLAGSKSANDLADCMLVLAEHGDRLTTMLSYAEHIFKQVGTIRLLTGHKSKGLEFENVYFLDPELLRPDEQDLNLRYVIQTRSQNKLTTLDSGNVL